MKKSFWAARPFGYGNEYPMLDPGQVIEIEPGQHPNDEKLIRLGLLRELGSDKPVQCGKCGARFINDGMLNRHGRRNHAQTYIEAGRQEDPNADAVTAEQLGRLKAYEAADEYAEANIPLNLDKTKASREGRSRRASR